jgi:hypothetical protein
MVSFVLSTFLRIVASSHGFVGEKIRFEIKRPGTVNMTEYLGRIKKHLSETTILINPTAPSANHPARL